MNRFPRDESVKFNADCSEFMTAAERELAAFCGAVKKMFGLEQAQLSAEDWLHELKTIGTLPASAREWRLLTARASTQLATRVNSQSLIVSQ